MLPLAGCAPISTAAGTPAISLPAGLSDQGLSLTVQVSAPMGRENRLMQLACQLEESRPWPYLLPRIKPLSGQGQGRTEAGERPRSGQFYRYFGASPAD